MWLEVTGPALLMTTLMALLSAGAAGAMPVCAGGGSVRGDSQTECQLLGRVFRSIPHSFLPAHAHSVLVTMETVHSMRRSLRTAKRRKRSTFNQPSWNFPTQSTGSRQDESYCTTETTLQIPLLARSCHTDASVQLVQSPPLSVQPVLVSVCLPKHGVDNATCQQAYAPQMLLRSVGGGSARFELVWVESGCQVKSAMQADARQRQQHTNSSAHAPIAAAAEIIVTHISARDIIHTASTLKHTRTTILAAESPRTTRPAESPRTTRPAAESPRTARPAELPRTTRPAAESPRTARPAELPRTTRPAAELARAARPAAESPRTARPPAESPQMTRLAAESARTARPAAESPRTARPAAESPRTARLAAESPRTARPAAESPRTARPAAESPQMTRPAAESPQMTRPAAESDRANLTDSRVFIATGKLLTAEEVSHEAVADNFVSDRVTTEPAAVAVSFEAAADNFVSDRVTTEPAAVAVSDEAAADNFVSDRVTTEPGAGTPAGASADVPVPSTLVPDRPHKPVATTNYPLSSFAVPIAAKRASDSSRRHSAVAVSSDSLTAATEAGVTGSFTTGSSLTASQTSSNTLGHPQTRSQHIGGTSAFTDTEIAIGRATTPITAARSDITDPATGASETIPEVIMKASTSTRSGGSQARAYGILNVKKPMATTPGSHSTGGESSRKPDGNNNHVVVQTMMYTETSASSSYNSIPASSDAASASVDSFERLAWPNSRLASNSSYLRTIRKYMSGYNKHAGRSSKTSAKQDTVSTAPRRFLPVPSTTVRTNSVYVGNLNEKSRRRVFDSASYQGQATTELPEDLILDALASEAVTEAYSIQTSTTDSSIIDTFGRISSSDAVLPFISPVSPTGLVFNGASEVTKVPVDVQPVSTVWSDNKQIFSASDGESRRYKSTSSDQQLQSTDSISAQSRARKSVDVMERVAAGVSESTVQREDWQAVRRVVAAYTLGARSCGRQSSATGSIEAAHTLLFSLLDQQRVTTDGGSVPLCKARTTAVVRRMLRHERRLMAEQHEKLRQVLVGHFQQSEDALQQRILQLDSGSADILQSGTDVQTKPDVKLDLGFSTTSGAVSGDRKRGQTRQLQLEQPECVLYEQSNTDGLVINELSYLIDTLLGFSIELYLTFIPAEPLSRSAQSVPALSLPQYLNLRQSRVMRLISGSLRLYSTAISDLHEPILALETVADLIQSYNSSDGPTAAPTEEEEILQRLPSALYGMVLYQLGGMPGFALESVDSPNFIVPALVAFSDVEHVPADGGSHSLVLRLDGLLRRLWAVWRVFFNELIRPALRVRLQLQDNSRQLSLQLAQLTSVVTARLSVLPADVRQIVCDQLNLLLQLELTVKYSIGDLKQLLSQLVELLQLLGGTPPQQLQPFSQLSLVLQLSNGALEACYAFVIGLIEETTTITPSLSSNTTIPSTMSSATASSTGSFVTGVSTANPSTAISSTVNSITVGSSTNFITGTSNVVTDVTGSSISAPDVTIASTTATGTNIGSTTATVTIIGSTTATGTTIGSTTATGITIASTTATDTTIASITATGSTGISTAVPDVTGPTATESTIDTTTAASLGTESTIAGTTAASLGTESTIDGTIAASLSTDSTIDGTTAASLDTESTIDGTTAASLGTESTIAGTTAASLDTESTIAGTTAASLGTESTIAGTTAASLGTESTIDGTTAASLGTESTIAGTTAASLGTESTIDGTIAASLSTESTIDGTIAASLGTESTIDGTIAASLGTESTIAGTTAAFLVTESTTDLPVSTSTTAPSADFSPAAGVSQFTLAAADLTAAVTADSNRVAPIVNKHDLPTLDEILL